MVNEPESLVAGAYACKKEQTKLKDKLFRYREDLLHDDTAVHMLGVELSTGLSDATLASIAKNFTSVETVSDLINLGVPSIEHAEIILQIIHDMY